MLTVATIAGASPSKLPKLPTSTGASPSKLQYQYRGKPQRTWSNDSTANVTRKISAPKDGVSHFGPNLSNPECASQGQGAYSSSASHAGLSSVAVLPAPVPPAPVLPAPVLLAPAPPMARRASSSSFPKSGKPPLGAPAPPDSGVPTSWPPPRPLPRPLPQPPRPPRPGARPASKCCVNAQGNTA